VTVTTRVYCVAFVAALAVKRWVLAKAK